MPVASRPMAAHNEGQDTPVPLRVVKTANDRHSVVPQTQGLVARGRSSGFAACGPEEVEEAKACPHL